MRVWTHEGAWTPATRVAFADLTEQESETFVYGTDRDRADMLEAVRLEALALACTLVHVFSWMGLKVRSLTIIEPAKIEVRHAS